MKRNRSFFLLIVLVLVVSFFSSCRTIDHYIPATVDLTEQIDIVLKQRPNNSQFAVVAEPKDIYDISENANAYLYAWSMWEAYADAVEQTLLSVRDSLNGSP